MIMRNRTAAVSGPPVIFGAPRVGPPTVVAKATSAFKVWVYHIRLVLFVSRIG
jgi:hypothetical protein